jgi:hypothetical protein
MKLIEAIRIGLEILAMAQAAEDLQVPLAVNWSWKRGRKRLRLRGNLTVEDAD